MSELTPLDGQQVSIAVRRHFPDRKAAELNRIKHAIDQAPDLVAELATLRAQVAQLREATEKLARWFAAPLWSAFSAGELLLHGCPNELAADVERARSALTGTERSAK